MKSKHNRQTGRRVELLKKFHDLEIRCTKVIDFAKNDDYIYHLFIFAYMCITAIIIYAKSRYFKAVWEKYA